MQGSRSGIAVVGGCLIGLSMASSTFLFCFSIYLTPISKEFGWSRGELSFGFTIAAMVGAVLTPFVGMLIDRIGTRTVALCGAIAMPTVIFLLGMLPPIYPLFIALVVLGGVASALTSSPSYLSILPQWFDRNLGKAIAIAATGIGLGNLVLPWTMQKLADLHDWRFSAIAIAGSIAVLGILNNRLLMIENPDFVEKRRRGLIAKDQEALEGTPFAEAIRSFDFWKFSISILLVSFVAAACVVHIGAMAVDRGLTAADGAVALAVYGGSSIVARLLTGVMLDRLPMAVPALLFFGGAAIAALMLCVNWPAGTLLPIAVLLGAASGCEGDLMPFVLKKRFGMRAYGRLYGVMFAMFFVGPILGPLTMGFVFDSAKTYQPIFPVFVVMLVLAMLLFSISTISWKSPRSQEKLRSEGGAGAPNRGDLEPII